DVDQPIVVQHDALGVRGREGVQDTYILHLAIVDGGDVEVSSAVIERVIGVYAAGMLRPAHLDETVGIKGLEIGVAGPHGQTLGDLDTRRHLNTLSRAFANLIVWRVEASDVQGGDLVVEVRVEVGHVEERFSGKKNELHADIPAEGFFGDQIGISLEC